MDVRRYIGPANTVRIQGSIDKEFRPGDEVDFDQVIVEGKETKEGEPKHPTQTLGGALENVAHLFEPVTTTKAPKKAATVTDAAAAARE